MTKGKLHNTWLTAPFKFFGIFVVLSFLSFSAYSQNTKGDRPPVKNQRQIRETKAKSYRKKEKGRARDIANRRLRTKDQSSANRANAQYPKPAPHQKLNKNQLEKPARPLGRVFSKSPRESRTRAWKGDVSGYKIRMVRPGRNDAARSNVYPQHGPFVKKKPKHEASPNKGSTVKGARIIERRPRYEERAWKGAADRGPIKNQSATGSVRNVYPQDGRYVAYRKRLKSKDRPVSNASELSMVRYLTRKPRTGGSRGKVRPPTASRSYVQAGRKNVYWGKFSKKEAPFTSDLTGAPLRTRNFRSVPAGLVGRDTLKFFGRKPVGDYTRRAGVGGYPTATKKGQRGWKGDVAGFKLRKSGKGGNGSGIPGQTIYPRQLSITQTGEQAGKPILQGGYVAKKRRGEKAQLNSVPALIYAKPKGVGPRSLVRPGFSQQGAGYSGNIKRSSVRGFSTEGVNYSGRINRNSLRGFSTDGVNYSGKIKRSSIRGFSTEGVNYSGRIKRSSVQGFSTEGVNYSGRIKRGSIQGFSTEGVNYSGRIKRGSIQGFSTEGVNYSGRIKRSSVRGFSTEGVNYSGRIKRGSIQGFSTEGVNYSGRIKRSSVRGFSEQGVNSSGNIKRSSVRGFSTEGSNYSGRTKRSDVKGSADGVDYSGRIKIRKPEKGGGSVSGLLWNNNNQAIIGRQPLTAGGADFSGKTKAKRPEKGGGSVSGLLWNNENKAIVVKQQGTDDADYSGRIKQSRFKKGYVQNLNASKESLKKQRPNHNAFNVGGLMVKVKEGDYDKKPNANKGAMKGIAPRKSSVKANEYAGGMKRYWDYKHNSNSAANATKGIAPGKAMAHINDYQGNAKMHKYSGAKLHPDAQFAHGYRDNVKEERTFLMNVKLMWGKLFRKAETQPDNLKVRTHQSRYDKREKGMWND